MAALTTDLRFSLSHPITVPRSCPPLHSAFLAPSSLSALKNRKPSRPCNLQSRLIRKCISQMPALSSGLSTEVYDALAQLQVDLLQNAEALGLPLPANAESTIWWAVTAVPVTLWYFLAAPGSLMGLVDFAYAPVHSHSDVSYDAEEVEVGKQIGQGSFGIVYEGYIGRGKRKGSQNKELHVVLKKVKPRIRGAHDMQDAEVYMNRRVQRTAHSSCAEFLGTTEVSHSQIRGRLTEGTWLIWRYEGARTLDYYLKQRNFPDNVAEFVLGSKVSKERSMSKSENLKQQNAVIRKIMIQILSSLRDLHKTGLVHRDVKPLNLILAEEEGIFKLIDLGASVDIRSGYNYVPDETIIDPTYAAPEHHIMPTSTPHLPPEPLCSLISPLVWRLNTPDRFDLYSAGLILLQMAVRPLRQDIGLQSFNAELKRAGHNLDAWRKKCRFHDEEFSLLDADGGAGWELVRAMLQPRHDKHFSIWPSLGSSRPTAEAALNHRFFRSFSINLPTFKLNPTLPSLEHLKRKRSHESAEVPVRAVVPNIFLTSLPKFEAPQTGIRVDGEQVVAVMGLVMPTAAKSALTLAAGWLVFSGLKESAQATYAMGQWASESLGISGSVFLAFFLVIKPWLENQTTEESRSNIQVTVGVNDDGESSIKDERLRILLSTRQHSMSGTHTQTGLAEAVKEMELQLASLEASISAERQFGQHQQQQIVELEKLLAKTSRQPLLATSQSPKETSLL